MKNAVTLFALLVLSIVAASCGGGGGGSLNSPGGENPGVPSIVQLAPSQNVAQTGANITLSAKVLDGNGAALPNIAVTFTNLSPIGILSTAVPVTTDSGGIARVNISSATPGFATITAQVSSGAGFIRDKRSVFFTTSASANGLAFTPVSVEVDVDGDGNGVVNSVVGWNQTTDLNVCTAPGDNVVRIRATVFIAGVRAAGVAVAFTTDNDITATFPNTPFGIDNDADGDKDIDVVQTNSQGEAFSEVTINCLIQNNERILNVFAFTGSLFVPDFNDFFSGLGAVPLFLQPVTITGIPVTATPATVLPGGTSRIDATVNTTAGPLGGVAVSFTTSCGTVSPTVSQTAASGVATTTFTAPSTPGICTVTARVGSVTGFATVTVTTALTVQPPAITVNGGTGGTATFTIFGGVPSYTITRNNAAAWTAPVPATVTTSGGAFTVTVPAGTPATSVTYTIRDSVGTTVTATLTVTAGPALLVVPASQTVACAATGPAATYTITGGTAPYTVTTSHPGITSFTAPTAGDTVTVAASGGTFTIAYDVTMLVVVDTTVTITVTDSLGASMPATFIIDCP